MDTDMFATRLTLLLDAWHGKGEAPPSVDEVARKVGLSLGRVVPPSTIDAALNAVAVPPADVIDALEESYAAAGLFSVTPESQDLAHRLHNAIAIRDRYSDDDTNVIARGTSIGDRQLAEVLDFIGVQPR